jgi:hypothetical protein
VPTVIVGPDFEGAGELGCGPVDGATGDDPPPELGGVTCPEELAGGEVVVVVGVPVLVGAVEPPALGETGVGLAASGGTAPPMLRVTATAEAAGGATGESEKLAGWLLAARGEARMLRATAKLRPNATRTSNAGSAARPGCLPARRAFPYRAAAAISTTPIHRLCLPNSLTESGEGRARMRERVWGHPRHAPV